VIFIGFGSLCFAAFENGGGLYARAFYTKQERETWQADNKRMSKLYRWTHSYRIYCPEDNVTLSWSDAEKADWKKFYGIEK
ncbi:hypothetical protein U2087_15675, partial [Listeria monocytogenes]|uniref:hypothetical protein n=1 Tax=Listeria monocytogenes TaxID=1639 RepID=UPI002FDBA0B8